MPFAGDGDVTLATGHDEHAIGIDLTARVAFEQGKQTLAGHRDGDGDIGGFHKRRTQVHQVDEVLDDAAGLDSSGPSCGHRDLTANVVEVAFGAGKAWDTVIAADDDESVVELAHRFEAIKDHTESAVEGHALTEIIADIFADLVNIG